MQESEAQKQIPKTRRRWVRWLLPSLLMVLGGGMIWLNGPGLRWLAPRLAPHFLADSGMNAEFTVDGSLLGGLSVRNLSVTSDGVLGRLTIDRITPDYRLRDLPSGRLRGLEVEGAFIDIRLDAENADQKADDRPLAERIAATSETLRERLVPMDLELRDIAVRVGRGGEPLLEIAPSTLRHDAGEEAFRLRLGAMRDAAGNTWPAQESLVTWSRSSLAVDRIDPLPGISVRGLTLGLEESNALAAEAELRLGEAALFLTTTPGLGSLAMDLREGTLDTAWFTETFDIDLPLATTVTSFSLSVDNPLPEPARATGEVRMLFENTDYGAWRMPELSLDVALQENLATLAASGQALATEFSIRAESALERSDDGIAPGETSGTFNVADVSGLVTELAGRIEALEISETFPLSTVDGSFRVGWTDLNPATAELDLALKPVETDGPATLFLNADWQTDGPLRAGLQTAGAELAATMQDNIYQANATFDGFRSASIARWLAPFAADPGGGHTLTATWKGNGDLTEKTHQGRLEVGDYRLAREDASPFSAVADISYDWPGTVTAKALHIRAAEQSIRAEAELADGWLRVDALQWSDGERELLSGTAKLPAPADPGAWRETLAEDTRPLQADFASGTLPLTLLKDWLPAAAEIDARSTAKAELRISGSYAMPEIDAVLELREVQRAGQSDFPPADLDLKLTGRDESLKLDGALTVPGYPAAQIAAAMAFRPAQWAEDPASAATEPIDARAIVPRLDLANLARFVPGVKKLAGTASARIEVAGSLGTPTIDGRLELAGVSVETANENIPPIRGGAAAIEFTPERIALDGLRATIAGGTLRGDGSLTLVDGKPGSYDVRLTGNALPLLRNDSVIVRTNADLRLAGEHPQPSLTGSIAVVNSLYFRDIELLPIGVPITTPSAAKLPGIDPPASPAARLPAPFRDWPLDLRITTRDPFLIRGNLATGEITADLRIRGTAGNPLPDGQIGIGNLKAELPFSTLVVKRGSLRFTPETGFDPILDIRTTSDPRPYSVNGYIYGRASDPQLVLTSSPPLPETEIMTLLATGTTTSGLENPQNASSRALQLLLEETRRGRNFFGRQLRPLLSSLDRIDFTLAEDDPYSSDSYSTATLELTNRWLLSAGMSDDGDTRLLAIWRLVFH